VTLDSASLVRSGRGHGLDYNVQTFSFREVSECHGTYFVTNTVKTDRPWLLLEKH
jgi:hypothetical protein